jgi:uncharacterized membrane protein
MTEIRACRAAPATPDEKRAAFKACLRHALQGKMPPTETGLRGATIDALWAVADAVVDQQPTDDLVAKARAALAAELNT